MSRKTVDPLSFSHHPVRLRGTNPHHKEKTMRFLSMIRINEAKAQVPSERLMREMGELMEEMTRTGHLVSTAGRTPTSQGKPVRSRHGAPITSRGVRPRDHRDAGRIANQTAARA